VSFEPIAFELELPSGKSGFGQKDTPPDASLKRADEMLLALDGNPERVGDSDVVADWWIETHTLGCRNAADESGDAVWDTHFDIYDEYIADGTSCVFGDPSDGYFLTITPQRKG